MMKSLFEKDNLLPYVTEQNVPVAPKRTIFKPKLNKNGLSTAAFIVALSSLIFGIFIIPSVLGIALGVGAFIIAAKRGLPKKMPMISVLISIGTLIISVISLVLLLFTAYPEPEPYIPPAYTYNTNNSGLAYKYNPLSNIPCDSEGKCTFEVKLFPIDSSKCPKGGTFTPDMQDLVTKSAVPAEPSSFPVLKNGEEHTITITLISAPNSRLIEASSYPISCTR